jgi:dihydroflavonol-4-reductase
MKILITGATGFLGSYLCRKFIQEQYEVTILRRAGSNLALIDGLDLTQIVGDITDIQAVNAAVETQGAVVHAAARGGSGPEAIFSEVNVQGTQNVLAACKKQEVKRLLHVSSVAAVGIPADRDHPADETFPYDIEQCSSHYQASKKRAEEAVLNTQITGFDVVVVNPSWIFGPAGKIFRGSELMEKIQLGRITPYYLGGINAVHVEDVADGILSALKRGRTGERYILSGENISFKRIAELSPKGSDSERIFVPIPYVVSGLAAMTFEMIGKLTGRRPRLTWQEHLYLNRFHYYDSGKARAELEFDSRSFRKIVESYFEFKRLQSAR